eukprot:Seg2210.3 transcript_id=Seg2210.3/GoldUCD/mRNA.D3Y31 product="hypothetical protein" protein_id=Seg2210.3/GoldUCD/D3Y31
MCEEEMENIFKEARPWADEEICRNKEQLKEHMLARKTILEQNQMAKKEQEVRSVVRRSKLVAEISKFGNEWRTVQEMESFLGKCTKATEKKRAIEAQIKYQKYVLQSDKLFSKDKSFLFKIAGNNYDTLFTNLREIIQSSPHYAYLADISEGDTVRITGATVLSEEDRKQLYVDRVKILKEKLELARHSRLEKQEMASSGMEIIGKRVEHTFMVQESESQRRKKKLIYTGTVSRIVRKSNDPLYTRYEIIYDVDNTSGDN